MSGCGRRGMDARALRRPLPDAAALKIVMRGGADKEDKAARHETVEAL
jgi:hypothetical protein